MQKTIPSNRFARVPIEYKEQLMVGYRHFDTNHIKPQFPFGYGLSYTKFAYLGFETDSSTLTAQNPLVIRINLKNIGDKEGKEIVQLYIRPLNPPVFRPFKELKDFQKIALAPQETAVITFQITPNQLAYYDIERKGWYATPGDYEVQIGTSSSDIFLTHKISYQVGV
jgi:beta-glucosidase